MSFVSFTDKQGATHTMQVAEVIRYDSGPGVDGADRLDILTSGGNILRFWEGSASLEVQWLGDEMWQDVPLSEAIEPSVAQNEPTTVENELGNQPGSTNSVWPPPRLLSKGGGGVGARTSRGAPTSGSGSNGYSGVYVYHGGVWHRGGGGRERCDPAFVEGQHDPNQYCDHN